MRVQLGSNKRVRLGSTVVQDENKKYKSSLEQGAGLERGGHPYGVKPLGNRYLDQGTGIVECRNTGLGVLHPLEDGKVQDLFAFLSAKDLCALAPVSKAVYIFCHDDSLWRQHCLDRFKGDFRFQGTWRATYQHEVAPEYPIKHKPLIVQGFYSDELFQPWLCASADIDPSWAARNTVPRRSGLSVEDFVKQYETPNRPVILRDVVKDWPAFNGKWTKEALLEKYGETVYKCGRCDMKLKDYLQYADQVQDETPFYLFDNDYGEKSPDMLSDYQKTPSQVPKYFRDDFFRSMQPRTPSYDKSKDPHCQPRYRWILIGPRRSGSTFHKDPNSTSAWNGLISGRKKWILLPPHLHPPGTFPSEDGETVTCPTGLMEWFLNFYNDLSKPEYAEAVECVQEPGDLLFIPNQWWHCALNLEPAIAVTQNYVSQRNLLNVVRFLRLPTKHPALSVEFEKCMQEQHPGLIARMEQEEVDKAKKRSALWDSIKPGAASGSGSGSGSSSNSSSSSGGGGFTFSFSVGEDADDADR